jgi:hypothetical protein
MPRLLALLSPFAAAAIVAGCGSSSSHSGSSTTPTTPSTQPGGTSTQGGGALVAEAQAAASGDIPDNQVFLVFDDKGSGYSMRYPEGWALAGSGGTETIRDKNNLIRISVANGAAPTAAQVQSQLAALKAATPSLAAGTPQTHPSCTYQTSTRHVPAAAVRVDYATQSAPNPVTGKRVKLLVNRYYLAHAGKLAVVDLGTPQGVDNVDAYCLMITSFRWH